MKVDDSKRIDMAEFNNEILQGKRFAFGKNWSRYLSMTNEDRIITAENSLKQMLELEDLKGKRFLDIGSGSGLFSLAARRLGAKVHSFDYDPFSVACTEELKRLYFTNDTEWVVEKGSVLDAGYVKSLGQFDIIYSWGVLHHTSSMSQALGNAQLPLKLGGQLFIAIYNDQGWVSDYWHKIKKLYNSNLLYQTVIILIHAPYLLGAPFLSRLIKGNFKIERGMSIWYDMFDWLGGYPFETAKPEDILDFYKKRGFVMERLKTCRGRHGCNEYIFKKIE